MSGTNGKGNGKAKRNGNGTPEKPMSLEPVGIERDELGRVKPGQVLNPHGGRNRFAVQVMAGIRSLLEETTGKGDDDRTKLRALVESLYDRAIEGDNYAAKLILERVCPATIQAEIDVTGIGSDRAGIVFDQLGRFFTDRGELPVVDV